MFDAVQVKRGVEIPGVINFPTAGWVAVAYPDGGGLYARDGDWIVTDPYGERYPTSREDFDREFHF